MRSGIAASVLALSLLVTLALGCSSTSRLTEAGTPIATQTSNAAFSPQQQHYLRLVHHAFPNAPARTLLREGRFACDGFRAGQTPSSIIDRIAQHGMPLRDAATLTVASAATLCPRFGYWFSGP